MRQSLVLILLCSTACAVETIVAAHESDGGAPELDGGATCRGPADCAVAEYCLKEACDAEFGRCEPRPTVCDARAQPVCGCDGVTYYNDCLRRQHRVGLASSARCDASASPCGGAADQACPAGAECARFAPLGASCEPRPSGTCWLLPDECNPEAAVVYPVSSCASETNSCLDLCTAIRLGAPVLPVSRCQGEGVSMER